MSDEGAPRVSRRGLLTPSFLLVPSSHSVPVTWLGSPNVTTAMTDGKDRSVIRA